MYDTDEAEMVITVMLSTLAWTIMSHDISFHTMVTELQRSWPKHILSLNFIPSVLNKIVRAASCDQTDFSTIFKATIEKITLDTNDAREFISGIKIFFTDSQYGALRVCMRAKGGDLAYTLSQHILTEIAAIASKRAKGG